MLRMLQTNAAELEIGLASTASPRFAHDFSRIPIHSNSPANARAELAVGHPRDIYEQEADRVSEQVMQMSEPQLQRASPCGGGCPEYQTEQLGLEHESLQMNRVQASETGQIEAPTIVHDVLRSPGQPLDPATRAFMEPRFDHDFSSVRIHADARAAESANFVHARAYTVGQHVAFGRDQYSPRTAEGRHLLAHELTHTLQQQGGMPSLRRAPPESPPPPRPDLETRLQVIEETGAAARTRLDEILRTGGPMPNTKDGAKVIGAAIIDVEGYEGPTEIRAINGADTDALGRGAPVHHAESPKTRTLSQTQGPRTERGGRRASIRGPRNESIYPHINDAEVKIFEEILSRLPENAKGTIHFTTVRIPKGQTAIEPYPACSGCVRASFEAAGRLKGVDFVSHAPTHPTGTADLGGASPDPGKPPAQGERPPVKPASPEPKPASHSRTVPKAPSSTPEPSPAVKPAAPEVTVPQPKVETPPVGGAGTGATSTRLGVEASRLRTVGRFLAEEAPGLLFQAILMAIFPPEVHIHNENYGALSRQKIDPALQRALAEQAATFNKLAADDPAQSIWATVTVESEYRVEATSGGDAEIYLQDLRFIEMKLTHEYLLVEGPKFQVGAGAKASKKVTYSVPIFGPATRASEEAIRNFRNVREGLTNSAHKVRLSAMLNMYRIAEADSFLKNQLVRDLQPMLNDDESIVREVAARLLSRLKAER